MMRTKTWWGTALMLLGYAGCIATGIGIFMVPLKPGAETVQFVLGVLMLATGVLGPVVYLFTGEFPIASYEEW